MPIIFTCFFVVLQSLCRACRTSFLFTLPPPSGSFFPVLAFFPHWFWQVCRFSRTHTCIIVATWFFLFILVSIYLYGQSRQCHLRKINISHKLWYGLGHMSAILHYVVCICKEKQDLQGSQPSICHCR